MKHIYKYNKFIKLNEDIEINGDIDEHDLNIIKDGLIELGDLGWNFHCINIHPKCIYINLDIKSYKISKDIYCYYRFDKEKFDKEEFECIRNNSNSIKYTPNIYEQTVIDITKDKSIAILNIIDYDHGEIIIENSYENTVDIKIILHEYKKY